MKKIICILLFYIPCCCFTQTNNQSDSLRLPLAVTYSNTIYFEFDSIQPTSDGLQFLNKIGSTISSDKEMEDKFWFVFHITASKEEQRNNINLEFKRMLFVLNYLQQNYNIKQNNFIFTYCCTSPEEFSISFSMWHKTQ